ncbi:MAG: ROK family transcriptional regulator [Devosiaceae bacterium]|nr:ROK family transcriptional regulator [Devosiaceae bacterium]
MVEEGTGVIGSNAGRSRSHNRRVVLDFVRAHEPAGRAEISRSCGLSIQAVSNIIDTLEGEGLLRTVGHRSGMRGKPALQYQFNPDGAFALGVEILPDAMVCALLNLSGKRIFSRRKKLPDASPEKAIPAVTKLIASAIEASGRDRKNLLGTGIVMPGPFGKSGLSFSGAAVPGGWESIDIRQEFEKALNCPVIIENDATAAAVSERLAGAASELNNFCFIYFGTGLGLGVIAGGHSQRGALGNAGEIGHIITKANGLPCPCGNFGCLETYASRMGAFAFLEKAGGELPEGFTLASLLEAQNPAMLEWVEVAALHLSQAIGMVENLFDPETVILGGAIADVVIDALIAKLDLPTGSIANRPARIYPRVMRGSSGRLTAAIGGAAMIIHRTITPTVTVFH